MDAICPTVTVPDDDSDRILGNKEAKTLYETANRLIQEKHYLAAIVMLRRSIALRPDDYAPWNELGVSLHALGRFDEAINALRQALRLNPNYDNARSNLALIKGILGEFEEAEEIMQGLIQVPARRVPEEIHLGLMLLAKGDWKRGLELYEKRVGIISREFKLPRLGVPYWQGEDLNGKRFYVQTEQGIGDTIAFSRYIAWVKATWPDVQIKFCCHKEYSNLFWDFRHLVSFVPSGVLWPDGNEQFDCGAYLHSLARHADAEVDRIYPDPGLIAHRVHAQHKHVPLNIPQPLSKHALKIGIAWTGNPENATQARRSVPLENLLYLVTDPNNVLYSLQCGVGQVDITRLGAQHVIEDLSSVIKDDLVVCGAAMMELDVVVTCCTSIAHLAGAIGVPCFLLLCHDPYWLWGRDPTTTPWYSSVRLFRQKTRGEWGGVVADVAAALREL